MQDSFAIDARGSLVRDLSRNSEEIEDIYDLVEEARHWWDQRQDFRDERQRARNYERGKQWEEYVTDPDDPTEQVQEKELIERQGRIPWVINQIGAITRNLRGQFTQNTGETAAFAVRGEDNEAVNMINVAMRSIKRHNRLDVLDPDNWYEHIISGAHAWRVDIQYYATLDRDDVHVAKVDNTRLFYNLDIKSRRLDDLRMIGQIHDFTPDDIVAMFGTDELGNYDHEKASRLRDEVASQRGRRPFEYLRQAGFDHEDALDFFGTDQPQYERIVEIWYKKHELVNIIYDPEQGKTFEYDGPISDVVETNKQRVMAGYQQMFIDQRYEEKWWVLFATPYGFELRNQRSPYWHGQHPYVLGLANLVDGETWGLIYQIIDPQRWLNRIVSMVDFSLSSSAKGVLLVPEDTIPDDMDLSDIATQWTRANGVIKIKLKPGATIPQQITGNAIVGGTFEMLQSLQEWMDTTSGVTGPVRGVDPNSGTPASLYQAQITQASITNLDFFESFFQTGRERDLKIIQTMLQAYADPFTISDTSLQGSVFIDPERIRKIHADVSMANVGDTAVYRQLFEQDMKEYLGAGYLTFGQYLQMSSHPKAQTLLKILQTENPHMLNTNAMALGSAIAAQSAQQQGIA